MGEELLLFGQRAVPERALASGYQFRFPDLEDSLRHQLDGARTPGEPSPDEARS
jgi:NAD dependent epimerase/dehydratase family enzyme